MNQEDIYNLQNSSEDDPNKDKSSEIIEREKIQNSPFEIIGNKERGYFLTMGQFKLSDSKPSIEELLDHVDKDHWNLIADMICTISEQVYKKLKEKGE